MENESYFLRFSWGPRPEDIDACAHRIAGFLSDLSDIHSAFAAWRRSPQDSEALHTPIDFTVLKQWLSEGVNRPDVGNGIMPELGYSLSLVANEDDSPVSMRIGCGKYAGRVPNVCSIVFPKKDKGLPRLLEAPILSKIAEAVVRHWEAERGIISSHESRDISSPANFESEAGWITYLPNKFDELSIPDAAEIIRLNSGRLIIATFERLSSTNAIHINFIKRLSRSMEAVLNKTKGDK